MHAACCKRRAKHGAATHFQALSCSSHASSSNQLKCIQSSDREAKHCSKFRRWLFDMFRARMMPANYANRLNAIGFRVLAKFLSSSSMEIDSNAN